MPGLSIAGLARAADVGVETVRYYQRRGLLETPARPDGCGQSGSIRRYDNDDVRRLRFIRSAQAAGFTLEQIGELLALDATEDRARVRALAKERLVALGLQIEALKKARDSLRRLARECASGSAGPCPILTSFDHAGG
ncbi:MerR family transcriptional regulator [Sphingomonas sp. CFBP 13728]|uniref:MerR family transcriptional regulator n=1 Tax=unclassified Sphingomonas TaxID=196159 RepID=UPI0017806F18|nr:MULTISPECIES: MerR family transcriptional regulator [unclassified Sphingomonas]MBD8620825.1 MerR family transcriptional regulator [Sphingomonas sp. CFBP 13728]MBD8737197.1 MerR family transcriptional regulator [Sphingomonas sp. CFBP 13706]